MTPITRASSRVIAVAGSLALALALASGPAVLAQDDGPDATIVNLMAAIEAKDLEALPTFFCPEFADQASNFDLSDLLADLPPDTDPSVVLDAFVLSTEIESLEVLSQSDTEAVVKLVGSLEIGLDPDAMGPFVELLLVAAGQEPTPDMVDMMTGMLASQFEGESVEIDEEITMAPGEAMTWVVCDELGSDDGSGPESSPEASPHASPSA